MRFKIHYSINGFDDYFVIEGETIEEIREKADSELLKRGLDVTKNSVCSEEIK